MYRKLRWGFIGLKLAALWLLGGYQFASAEAGEWRLIQAEGVVRIMLPGAGVSRAREAMLLPQGTVITTGAEGKAVLALGSQQINLSADTRLTLAEQAEGMVGIHQASGTAVYQVESRSVPHFRVDTALMAAVVKGTSFRIEARKGGDALHVVKGLVEVSARDSEMATMVGAGQVARIDRLFPSQVSVTGTPPSDPDPSAPAARPVNFIQAGKADGAEAFYADTQAIPQPDPVSDLTQSDAMTVTASAAVDGNKGDRSGQQSKPPRQRTDEPVVSSGISLPPPEVLASLLFLTFSIACFGVIALIARRSG